MKPLYKYHCEDSTGRKDDKGNVVFEDNCCTFYTHFSADIGIFMPYCPNCGQANYVKYLGQVEVIENDN